MNEHKKIEPTAAMVRDVECWRSFTGTADRTPLRPILRAALNHYDAPGLFADEGATRAAREQGWDEAAEWGYRSANLGHYASERIKAANPHRPVQNLPTKPGTVIVPADGHEYIEATMRGETVRAREATRSGAGGWYAAWRSGEQTSGLASSREITPGTWKVDDQ